ncbi:purine-nucleoside phosphorylase [Clostridium sp. WILCCON 0269]|uniref:Purine nucleoside phosphorylase n=1 Tax=Candidatus Clostridium eludens TaxID=3381663 RepID=A0ABW8SNS6_9CLOT
MDLSLKIKETVDYINRNMKSTPKVGIILGSGLGNMADEIEEPQIYNYNEIPHFPVSTVEGHKNRFIIGELEGKSIVAMQGRFHYYEGYSMEEITFPIRVMKKLGVEILIVTNAAGGLNRNYRSGELMLIEDHINLSGQNPLIGKNLEDFGTRFPDMSEAYNKKLREIARHSALQLGIQLQEGVYAYMSGPSYETPAEINMLSILGGDAVGMSTVPEVIVANHSGMKVMGISCITNMAAGILKQPLNHEEVIKTSAIVANSFKILLRKILGEL